VEFHRRHPHDLHHHQFFYPITTELEKAVDTKEPKHTMRGVALTASAVARPTRIENFMLSVDLV